LKYRVLPDEVALASASEQTAIPIRNKPAEIQLTTDNKFAANHLTSSRARDLIESDTSLQESRKSSLISQHVRKTKTISFGVVETQDHETEDNEKT